jgi:hypothetical protein
MEAINDESEIIRLLALTNELITDGIINKSLTDPSDSIKKKAIEIIHNRTQNKMIINKNQKKH